MSERYIIPSLERALHVIDLLSDDPDGLTFAEMGRRTDIPKSTLFRILVTLQKHHCVAWNEGERLYRLGSRLWQYGNSFIEQSDLYHASSKYMKLLAEQSRETVFLGGLEDGEVIYLRRMESPKSITVVRKLKQRVPAHCTATGVAMLAFLPPAEVESILDRHGMAPYNEATLTDREKFMARLSAARRDGYAVVDGEYNRELLCISAPVFDHAHRPCASLTVAMLSSQVNGDRDRLQSIAAKVREVAQACSCEMGYSNAGST